MSTETIAALPAAPGWRAVMCVDCDESTPPVFEFEEWLIVGWAVCRYQPHDDEDDATFYDEPHMDGMCMDPTRGARIESVRTTLGPLRDGPVFVCYLAPGQAIDPAKIQEQMLSHEQAAAWKEVYDWRQKTGKGQPDALRRAEEWLAQVEAKPAEAAK